MLTTAACGGDHDSSADGVGRGSEDARSNHNAADVAFATDMIQHHAQALSMVDLTMDRTLDPEVQALAESIRAAQAPEIELMADWLVDWGEEIPATMRDHTHAGHDMGDMDDMGESLDGLDHDMPGMLSPEELDALQDAPDPEFQTRWLESMIEHHEGAVEMARTAQDDGAYAPAIDLAGSIIESQSAEINQMKELIG
ncbi:MAG TPA: DUF305 domain-containing protein [Nocardioides sp.]|nr:DUF305 domain-containing protein [uncultured Nocardioides sp.]HRI94776.1 DUF305 domain-containing protein [Nocardioides sp.]HRK47145.1 DUF305 domain-containing protein [Nocardioides sp.]